MYKNTTGIQNGDTRNLYGTMPDRYRFLELMLNSILPNCDKGMVALIAKDMDSCSHLNFRSSCSMTKKEK